MPRAGRLQNLRGAWPACRKKGGHGKVGAAQSRPFLPDRRSVTPTRCGLDLAVIAAGVLRIMDIDAGADGVRPDVVGCPGPCRSWPRRPGNDRRNDRAWGLPGQNPREAAQSRFLQGSRAGRRHASRSCSKCVTALSPPVDRPAATPWAEASTRRFSRRQNCRNAPGASALPRDRSEPVRSPRIRQLQMRERAKPPPCDPNLFKTRSGRQSSAEIPGQIKDVTQPRESPKVI